MSRRSFYLGAKSVEELSLRIMKALYKVNLSMSAVTFIVGKNVKPFTDLSEVASILKSSGDKPLSSPMTECHSSSSGYSGSKSYKQYNKLYSSQYKCFKCGLMGHRSFECRVKVENQSSHKVLCYAHAISRGIWQRIVPRRPIMRNPISQEGVGRKVRNHLGQTLCPREVIL